MGAWLGLSKLYLIGSFPVNFRQENKCQFWTIFAEALEEYSESINRANKHLTLLSNFRDKDRGLSPSSEAGFCHQLALVPSTDSFCTKSKLLVGAKFSAGVLLIYDSVC